MPTITQQVVCVTGGAKRIGKAIVETFHQAGFNVIIHYQASEHEATLLAQACNQQRPNSAKIIQGDLTELNNLNKLAGQIADCFGRLDVLVHNASRFFATPFGQINEKDWQNLIHSNAKAPLFLTQAVLPLLTHSKGKVVSILDIHADNHPFAGYSVYNMAKAAHRTLVQSLALELAPRIRVNGVAPGVNILPAKHSEQALNDEQLQAILRSIPLQRVGEPQDIAQAVLFLATAPYITGQVITVDGGRSLTLAGSL